MIIKSIDILNFRNYEIQNIDFDEKINILYGENAQGKTNVLEAIYVCGTTRSHKGSKDHEMIAIGQDEAHLKTIVSKKGIDYRIDMHIKKNKSKGVAINGVPIKKSTDLYGIINIVFFSPEDLGIIKSGPADRRKFMNMELCQLDKIYVSNLINYGKALEQRNKLLKSISFNPSLKETLEIWDMQLVKYGCEIIRARKDFIQKLNEIIKDIHLKLSGNVENLHIEYEPSVTENNFEKVINQSLDKDIRVMSTSYGPHRDDIKFMIDGIDIRYYGSQGQQRTTALSLKLAEIELVKQIIGDTPILLLDDVLSELDNKRQNYLLDSIDNIQTIITCPILDDFIKKHFDVRKVFKVVKGKVFVESN